MFCLNIAFLIARERKVKNKSKILKKHADEPEEDNSALANATCNPPMKQGTNLSWLPQNVRAQQPKQNPLLTTLSVQRVICIFIMRHSLTLSLDIMHKDSGTPSTNILS